MIFVLGMAAVLLGIAALIIGFKIAVGLFVVILPLFWVLLTLAGVFSVIMAKKKGSLKLLWLIIIFLAPIFGPLLWFFWGKNNT